jgi:hypothetical protein
MNFGLIACSLWLIIICIAPPAQGGEAVNQWKERTEALANEMKSVIEKLTLELKSEDTKVVIASIRGCTAGYCSCLVAQALRYPASSVQMEAAKRLAVIGCRSDVSALVAALQAANADLLMGGSEVVIQNRELKRALLSTIQSLTSLDFSKTDVDSQDSVNEAIESSSRWLKKSRGVP